MSESRLPHASGSGGRSVFTVFGFGNRYSDDDFENPLESAPESFDASNYHVSQKKKKNTRKETSNPLTPGTVLKLESSEPPRTEILRVHREDPSISHDQKHAPKIPRPMWAFIPPTKDTNARKLRVNLPDNSGMVLQSFCQGNNSKASPSQSQPGQAAPQDGTRQYTSVRRYSVSQDEAKDQFDSSQVLQKFTSSMAQSSAYIYSTHGGANKGLYKNLVQYSHEDTPTSSTFHTSQPASHGILTRVQSSPHLATSHGQLQVGRTDIESSVDASPGYQMVRGQSHGDLQSMVKSSSGGDDNGKDNKISVSNKTSPTQLSSQTQQPTQTDMTDNNLSHESGFGILSRTRQFGTWLTKATDGEKVEVTKKDLNVFAPTSF